MAAPSLVYVSRPMRATSAITWLPTNLRQAVLLERELFLHPLVHWRRFSATRVIADVALIGRDTYTNEGAAIGMLFQARGGVLAGDLTPASEKRALAREKDHGATAETVENRRARCLVHLDAG